jgi:hypothetical protein
MNMRNETFDYLNHALFNLTEALSDETLDNVKINEIKKAYNIIEDVVEGD